MLEHEFPILEFDGSSSVMIDPQQHRKPIDIAEHAVACFFQDVLTQLAQQHKARTIAHLESEIGTYPLYEIEFEGKRLAVFHPGVGAPWAAFSLEEMIALGCKKFIACGALVFVV